MTELICEVIRSPGRFGLSWTICGTVVTVTWATHRKERNETEHGYTTSIKAAVANPELYQVDYKTLAVLSKPHEPRFTRSALRRN